MIKLSVGKDVDSYCTKCRLELGHIITAMADGKIAKVKCNTCGGVHNYRAVKKIQEIAAAPKKKALPKKKEIKEVMEVPGPSWETCISKARGSNVQYEMGKAFKVGDIITHDIFGKGVVLEVSNKKCAAIFSDAKRILVSAN